MAEYVLVRADQCHVLPDEIDDTLGTMIEPFAVALHAVKRVRRRVGQARACVGRWNHWASRRDHREGVRRGSCGHHRDCAARRAKAAESGVDVVFDPDANDFLEKARELTGDGFDVIFEASASTRALRQAFEVVRPGGTIVQIGTVPNEDIPLPALRMMHREFNYIGSQRYGNVFDEAIRLVASGRVDLRPLYSGEFAHGRSRKGL